jgi:hypothetical protein
MSQGAKQMSQGVKQMSASIMLGVLVLCAALIIVPEILANATALQVKLDANSAGPRELEETTRQAIIRDYSAAWQAMAQALDQNRVDALGSAFAGTARDQLAEAVRNQQQSGLRTVYVDHGHALKAMFYAQEGSAMQLRDVANYEVQIYDHGAIVYSEQVIQPYIVVMTPTADHWQVRIMEAAAE